MKDLFKTKDTIILDKNNNRNGRRIISDLRKEGIIFIPIGNYVYKRIEKCDKEQIDKYINEQIASLNTQYFNSLKPVKNYMSDEQLKNYILGV